MGRCFPCFGWSKNVDIFNSDKSKSCNSNVYKGKHTIPGEIQNPKSAAQPLKFEELMAATNNFSPECFLGEGGFGRVYKGQLPIDGTQQVVAVKQLDLNGLQGENEFRVEVMVLSYIQHQNLVNLLGYCVDGDQRLLVYEYMPLGSLEDHLHDLPPDKEPLDWNTRMKIAAGAAKALEYLHDRAEPRIIYRDLKSSNILLGEGFHSKLSDFGLAKFGPTEGKSHVSTRVMGTYGYCAPEYALTGQLTPKSDIYSFGVVLLELITGRKAYDTTRTPAEHNLVSWAKPFLNDKSKAPRMVDPTLGGRYPRRGLHQALTVASMCVQGQAATRPLIGDVVNAMSFLSSQNYDSDADKNGRVNSSMYKTSLKSSKRNSGRKDCNSDSSLRQSGSSRRNNVSNYLKCCIVESEWTDDAQSGSPSPAGTSSRDVDVERKCALAEAKVWGQSCRERAKANRVRPGGH